MQTLTTTISGGNLPPAIMAKALLYRGMAYRNQQKPAQAISDITGALWLKGGLSPTDRTSALQQRTAAYQEAGLTESGEPLPKSTPTQARERPAQTASTWGAATTTSSHGHGVCVADESIGRRLEHIRWWSVRRRIVVAAAAQAGADARSPSRQRLAPFAATVKATPEPGSPSRRWRRSPPR